MILIILFSSLLFIFNSKIVDKKEILHTVSNTGIYCSRDKVGTVYLGQCIFENSTVNINALCNSCRGGHGVLLVCTAYSVLYSEIALSRKPFGIGHMYTIFLLRMSDTMTSQNMTFLLGHSVRVEDLKGKQTPTFLSHKQRVEDFNAPAPSLSPVCLLTVNGYRGLFPRV
jgi:hypothetical protein